MPARKSKKGLSLKIKSVLLFVSVALVGMNEVVREVFDVTGLDEVFEIR